MSKQQLENMKEAFDCNEVVRLHQLEIAVAGDVTVALCNKMDLRRPLVENSAWQILGHTPSEVSILFCYDLPVQIDFSQIEEGRWPES